MKNEKLSIKRYSSYKDSGVEWLGEVPEHWKIKRLKDLTKILTCGLASTPEYVSEQVGVPFLSAQNVRPNRLDLSKYSYISKQLHKQLTKYRKPQRNDVLVTRVGAGIGDACIIDTDFEFSIYVSLTHIRTNNQLLLSFLVYFFGTAYLSILNKAGTPDGGGQGNLNVKNVNRFLIPTPPLPEQKAIAHYLDTKTAQCDRKIALLTQKAKLYGNLKQSLINETVTRGLDKTVPMCDRGVEWLGEVPEHWEIKRLKEVIVGSLTYGANETATDSNPQHPRFIRITDFSENEELRNETFKSLPPDVAQKYLLKEGDILFARSGATIGKTFHFKNYQGKACYAGYLIKARPKSNILSSTFLSYYTKSGFYNTWKSQIFIKATIENISAEKYGFFLFIPLPPLCEQKAITDYLDTKIAQIDKIIQTINTQIEKLKELRKTLINDVVTGKIKVTENL